MFLSEQSFQLFLRDVCAMANQPKTGTIEFLFREYIKIIEHMGVGNDAPDEDSAYYDRISVLAITAGRILAAPPHLRLSDLEVAKKRAGLLPEPIDVPVEAAPDSTDRVESVLEQTPVSPQHTETVESESLHEQVVCDDIETPLPPQEEPPTLEEPIAPYSEGTQVHDQNAILDMHVPVADFECKFEVRRRRGCNRHIKQHVATSSNKFADFKLPDDAATEKIARRATAARLLDDRYKKRLPPGVKLNTSDTAVVKCYKMLDKLIYDHQLQRIPESILSGTLLERRFNMSYGVFLLLMRHGNAISSWRPRVKLKQAVSVLLN